MVNMHTAPVLVVLKTQEEYIVSSFSKCSIPSDNCTKIIIGESMWTYAATISFPILLFLFIFFRFWASCKKNYNIHWIEAITNGDHTTSYVVNEQERKDHKTKSHLSTSDLTRSPPHVNGFRCPKSPHALHVTSTYSEALQIPSKELNS